MSKPLSELLNLLQLERLEKGLFRGQSENLGLPQVYGGQVIGQALSAPLSMIFSCPSTGWWLWNQNFHLTAETSPVNECLSRDL